MNTVALNEPWNSFLRELDEQIEGHVELYCIGGFVMTEVLGQERPTEGIDFLDVLTTDTSEQALIEKAGTSSPLQEKYRVFLERVAKVPGWPDNYKNRMIEVCRGCWRHISLYALEPHDLAILKIWADRPQDQQDITYLIDSGLINAEVLQQRYDSEVRPHLQTEEDETKFNHLLRFGFRNR